MKREQQIEKLVAVGFSKPELQRQPNSVLQATYESAKPLMEANAEQVRQAQQEARLRARALRLRNERQARSRAHADQQRRMEVEWNRNWRPAPPICTVKSPLDVKQVGDMIAHAKSKAGEFAELFRSTGEKQYATLAQQAREMMQSLTTELQGMLS